MSRYAAQTDVTADRSRAEIEKTLTRYGANSFMYGWVEGHAAIGFQLNGRAIKFVLPMPNPNDREFTHTPEKNQERKPEIRAKVYDQAVRQKWRALALAIKAKLEAVESGITEFDQEFLAHIIMPDGKTISETILPGVQAALENRTPTPLLPDYS